MVAKRQRVQVVFDTNVFVRALKKRSGGSPNYRLLKLWLIEKKLQLVVCADLVEEYLRVFHDDLLLDIEQVLQWRQRFEDDRRVTWVNLGRRDRTSRDPDDDMLVATSLAGKVEFLISNDRDLLDISLEGQKQLRFRIVPPAAFLKWFDEQHH